MRNYKKEEYFCSVCYERLTEDETYFDTFHDCLCGKCLMKLHKAF